MKLIYKEELYLSLKAIFLLKIFFKLPNNQIDYSVRYDWMRREFTNSYLGPRDEHKSTNVAFYELTENELVEYPEVDCDSYLKVVLSKKGKYFENKVKRIDTKEFDDLIPEGFFK